MGQALINQTKKKMSVLFVVFQRQCSLSTSTSYRVQVKANNFSVHDVRTLCKQNRLKEALNILQITNSPVDSLTYVYLLQCCIHSKTSPEGKQIHALMIERGIHFIEDRLVQNKLIDVYIKCGNLADARRVFDQMHERDVCSWTVMIAAYARHGFPEEALRLFHQMGETGFQPNPFTFSSVLSACANLASLKHGIDIHEEIIRNGFQFHVSVATALVNMYAKQGCLEKAREVFDKMPQRNVFSWTAMIAGYSRHGCAEEALELFHHMQLTGIQPNHFTFVSVLPACANLASLEQGVAIHQEIIRRGFQSNVFVMTALVDMYAQCGRIEKAHDLFDKMDQRTVVSWNAMIAGYGQNGLIEEAWKLFEKMPERNVLSWTALISGYAQSGLVDKALELFEEMPLRTVVSWNAMIAGLAQNGRGEQALELFQQMKSEGVNPDSKTYGSILPVCAKLAALGQGVEIHESIIKSGLESNIVLLNALIDMYAKCGRIEKAHELFNNMHQRNVVSWTAMIGGYAMHGCGVKALKFFEQMQENGMVPNHVTLLSVLYACSHAGLVDEGYKYFNSMNEYYHIEPAMEHYGCMVDLLGRAGRLKEAETFISKMPIEPDAALWSCLLGACRVHSNIALAELVAEHLFEMDSQNAAPYVLLSNIYAAAHRWDGIEKVRKMMKDRGIRKKPGCSWIEVNKQVHAFSIGNKTHPQMQEIYRELERLSWEMKAAGYVPDMSYVLNDVIEEEKEQILCHHSEKLAIAFGLLNTSPGTTIRVVKNLRVCGDCHSATKFVSKIVAREIVLRDANRYHHFKDGECSCKDYW